MNEILIEYTEWYNRILTEWFTFIGQITVCYFIYKLAINYLTSKGFKANKYIRFILGLILFIVIIFPAMEWF